MRAGRLQRGISGCGDAASSALTINMRMPHRSASLLRETMTYRHMCHPDASMALSTRLSRAGATEMLDLREVSDEKAVKLQVCVVYRLV